MKSFSIQNERGFTLIEMSIVLIIIGLIIGGILKGQELIESARQKNFVSQIDSLRAGTNSFIDRFRAFPGDYSTTAVCSVCVAGNGDGILNTAAADAAAIAALDSTANENYQYFNMLMGVGFTGGGTAALEATGKTAFSGGTVISPLPQASFPSSGITIAYGTHKGGASNADSRLTNWLKVHKYITAGAVTATQAILSPPRAQQLDQKYDDGLPQTGRIRNMNKDNTNCGTEGTGGTFTTLTSVQCDLLISLE